MLHGSLLDVLRECEWLLTAPPNLLTCGGDESRRIADVVVNVLGRMQEGGAKRPYSLITKFLHFCFPGTFAIYDSQAGRSIQMWAVFAFDDAVQGEKDAASGFDEDSLADTNGRGYRSVLDFYRGVWAANEANVQAALESKASEMQDRIRAESGQRDARVTAIDLRFHHPQRLTTRNLHFRQTAFRSPSEGRCGQLQPGGVPCARPTTAPT
jgi:hypothetical protein